MKKYFVTIIGAAAFVIGGIITRNKALEGLDILEHALTKKSDDTAD